MAIIENSDFAFFELKETVTDYLLPWPHPIKSNESIVLIGIHQPLRQTYIDRFLSEEILKISVTENDLKKHFHNFIDMCASPGELTNSISFKLFLI